MRSYWFASLGVLGLTLPPTALAAGPARPVRGAAKEVSAVAALIDQRIAAGWGKEVKPAPGADDAEFFRRVSLDLIGRSPSITEIRDFLEDDRPDKRRLWVDELLNKESHSDHFTNVWRSWLLAQTNQQAQFQQPGLEAWLKRRLKKNVPYDQMIRELLTSESGNQLNQFGQNGAESPAAFFQANENKTENLAGSTARLFLGIKVECAQCHDHPFDKWTRTQFWEYAAFYATTQGQRGQQPQAANVREIKIPNTDKMVKARFLDGTEPTWAEGARSRTIVAEWMTSTSNPYFARAAVNRLWGYFFGSSLVDVADGQEEDHPASHRELLDELAQQLIAHGYDLKLLIQWITGSQTYQRTSAVSHPSQKDRRLFARMALRGMSAEQLFDSLAEATEYRDNTQTNPQFPFFGGQQSPRSQFLAKFSGSERSRDPETSILQALYLMNSSFVTDRTSLSKNRTLDTIARQRTSTARKVETLFLVVLSRKPRPTESERLVKYVEQTGASRDQAQALTDVFWVLLNSPEFILNH